MVELLYNYIDDFEDKMMQKLPFLKFCNGLLWFLSFTLLLYEMKTWYYFYYLCMLQVLHSRFLYLGRLLNPVQTVVCLDRRTNEQQCPLDTNMVRSALLPDNVCLLHWSQDGDKLLQKYTLSEMYFKITITKQYKTMWGGGGLYGAPQSMGSLCISPFNGGPWYSLVRVWSMKPPPIWCGLCGNPSR